MRALEAGLQEQASNHLKLHWLRAIVVSVKAKGRAKTLSGKIQEASASELLLRCRNELDDVKTGVLTELQDKLKGNLFSA